MAEKNLPVGQIVKDGQLIEFLGCQILKDNQWACGVVVSMFDFHCSNRGSNPGRGGEFS